MLLLLVAFAGGAALTWACDTLELIPWRRAHAAHWSERARLIHPARVGAVITESAIPLLALVIGLHLGLRDRWLTILAGAYLGAMAGRWPLSRALVPDLTPRAWLRLSVTHLVHRSVSWGMFAAAVYGMPAVWNARAAAVGILYLGLRLALAFGLRLRLLRAFRVLVPAAPPLRRLVDETAREMDLSAPATTWELKLPQANAYAAVTTREIIFTSALVQNTPDDELRAIARHELAHLAESRWMIASRLAGDMIFVPLIFMRPVLASWGGGGLALVAGVWGGLWLLRPMFVQALERRADRQAIAATPDATAYARVLERIHRINQMPAVLSANKLNTHPNLYDRMLAANVTPDYPRPAPAKGQPLSANVIVAAVTFGLIFLFQTRR